MDLLIKGGKVVFGDVIREVDIGVENGKIVGFYTATHSPEADEVVDAGGLIVLPGAIDVHPHIYDPELMGDRDDYDYATGAGAIGGLTSIVEMPTSTPCLSVERIKLKIEHGEEKCYVDFGLHGGNVRTIDDFKEIDELIKLGVISYKVFTCEPYTTDDYAIFTLMSKLKGIGVVMAHSENEGIIRGETEKLKSMGRKDPRAHHEGRPMVAEEEAITKLSIFAHRSGGSIHIVHMTSKFGVEAVRRGKLEGIDITAETCPHYLVFSIDDVDRLGPYLKTNPPFRDKESVVALWGGLRDGTVDMVTSEHFPTFKSQREVGWEDIWKVPSGLPGIETFFTIVFSEGYNKGRLSLFDLKKVLSINPAKRFGLHPRKGDLLIGADADIILVDPDEEWTIKAEKLHMRSDWSPFEGLKVKGRVKRTIIRGTTVFDGENLCVKPGFGEYIPRKLR